MGAAWYEAAGGTEVEVLQRLFVESYRSLRSVLIELDQLTVVTGANGSGKSNLYQALALVQAAADGRFKQALLEQGGMPSALWAGRPGKGPVRMRLSVTLEDLSYELVAGLTPTDNSATRFVLDPEVKEELLHFGTQRRSRSRLIDRGVNAATLLTSDGERKLVRALDTGESVLSQVGDPGRFPELTDLRQRLRGLAVLSPFRHQPARTVAPRSAGRSHQRACRSR